MGAGGVHGQRGKMSVDDIDPTVLRCPGGVTTWRRRVHGWGGDVQVRRGMRGHREGMADGEVAAEKLRRAWGRSVARGAGGWAEAGG
jgi:hypothetical protein